MKFTITITPHGYSIEKPGGGFVTSHSLHEPDLDELMGDLRAVLRKYFTVEAGGSVMPVLRKDLA